MAGSHDMFDPMEWPIFELNGELGVLAQHAKDTCTLDASDPRQWHNMDFAGQDTFMHIRPAHASAALERLMEGQLRMGDATAFTVIVPAVGLRAWRKYLKHFRKRKLWPIEVPGIGAVKHWYLRYEAGDGLLPKGQEEAPETGVEEDEVEETDEA